MGIDFNRRDLAYTIITRFEEAFRLFISNHLNCLHSSFTLGIPKGIIDRIKDRDSECSFEDCIEALEQTDFIDLKDIIIFQSSYISYFPNATLTQKQFNEYYDELYELRCKIAHTKPFNSIDLDKLIEIVEIIIKEISPYNKDINKYLKELKNDPTNITVLDVPIGFGEDIVDKITPNNIPTPDYEYDGGFVGRKNDIEQVKKLLLGNSHRVISITGGGGVGKTSLASKVVDEIIKKEKNRFDYIIWLSAKDKKLSYLGIEDVEPTVKDYEELLDIILEVTELQDEKLSIEEKEKNVNLILDMCNKILIVIDNLETITDEKIKNFILDSHPNLKILITSRKGLGQVNRIYELKELKEPEAIFLFRIICRDKNLITLSKLNDKVIKKYVKKVSFYPLAIKWLIGHASKGKNIDDVIKSINDDSSDITKFCFEQIYNDLSENAKTILCALSCFDDPPSSGILNFVVNMSKEDFEDGINELILVSLVVPEQYLSKQSSLCVSYILLPLTRGFVNNQLDKNQLLRRNIQDRLTKVQTTNEDAERAKKQYRFSLSNMGAVTDEEKVAAMLLQSARQKYQEGFYDQACSDYKQAQKIAPEFPTVYRNWSVMESQERHYVEADKLMAKAVSLNPKDPQTWLTWGNMKMKHDMIDEALAKYTEAYKLDCDDYVILNALGKAKCRLGEHKEADKLLKLASNQVSSSYSRKHEIMNRTSIAENLRRWGEILKDDRNFENTEEKLFEALNNINAAYDLDKTDLHTIILKSKINLELAFLYKTSDTKKSLSYFKNAIIENPTIQKTKKITVKSINEITNLLFRQNQLDEIDNYISLKLFDFIEKDPRWTDKIQEIQTKIKNKPINGVIIHVNIERKFCIIQINAPYDNTYLGFLNNFISLSKEERYKLKGRSVNFVPVEQNDKRIATMIAFSEDKVCV